MIEIMNLFTAEVVSDSSTITSDIIPLSELSADAALFLDLAITGDGTAAARYLVGDTTDDTFYQPSGASDICTGHTKTTNTTGRNRYAISSVIFSKFMSFVIEETGGADSVTATAKLVIMSGTKTR